MTVTTLRRVAASLNVTTDYIVNGIGCCENENLTSILDSLPEKTKRQAEKILLVFLETIRDDD